MSEAVILRWMQTLDARMEALGAEVARVQQSLATCQTKHAGERGLSLRVRGTATKIFVGLVLAVAGAVADRLTNR